MSDERRKPPQPSRPTSLPPEAPVDLESCWDDDTVPRLELDDPMSESAFDRVTAIPELPPEAYAKLMMEEQPASMQPARDAQRTNASAVTARPGRPPQPDPVLELDLGDAGSLDTAPPVQLPAAFESARDTQIREMKDRYAMGDFSGALIVAEGLLEGNAQDVDAQRYAQTCREVLTQMYSARLGALTQRVSVVVPGEQIRWLSLDHRAGFVLSLVDANSTLEELLDISGMNRLDALRILYTLYDQRVIALSER